MPEMTIPEAAEHFGITKEAIYSRIRRGTLLVNLADGVKYVHIDLNAVKKSAKVKPKRTRTSTSNDERYYKLLEEQNLQLQTKLDRLEGETKTLREQKEAMLIKEREKIEQIYKDKDEQLKSILTSISSQFMLNTPVQIQNETHLDAEIEEVPQGVKEVLKGELISLKKYLKKHHYSLKKKEKIKAKFKKRMNKEQRIILIDKKFYIDPIEFDYSDLIK